MSGLPGANLPLGECDREPITRLEHIQSFGFLLAVSKEWRVVRASANLADLLGARAQDAIGQPLERLIDVGILHEIRNRLFVLRAHQGTERLYGVSLLRDETLFDLAFHASEDLFILEGERSGPSAGPDAAALVRGMVGRLKATTTIAALHRDCARQIRALVGFGRVMIYRFEEDGSGEVIAESINGSMQRYEGLRYPATDIPPQARALYLRNPFRIIADVEAMTVPLLPAAAGDVPVLDLSLAVTRAVSPVHIEYLRNMGVAASLSISIIVEGRLWGLIACHHETARVPAFARRSASELFTQMYSMILENRLYLADVERDRVARHEVNQIIGSIASDRRLLHNAAWLHDSLQTVVQCDGVATSLDGRLASSGETPPADAIAAMVEQTGARGDRIFWTDRLATSIPRPGSGVTPIAGMLSIPMLAGASGAMLLFRRVRTVATTWGGDVGREVAGGDAATRLSPRSSFAAFTIETHDRSSPFTSDDRRAAEMMRIALVDIVSRIKPVDGVGGEQTSARQQMLIAELNHRVRNILSLIRGLISQTDAPDGSVAAYVQSLNGRVQALARAHDQVTRHHWGPGLLSTLFEHEVDAYVPTRPERFRLLGPAIQLLPEAFSTMALVVHELFTNSLKYGALSGAGRVEVTVVLRADGLHMGWRDLDGPPVVPPTRRGFGSAIIERTIPFDLHGTVDVRYPPNGIEVDLFVPETFVCPAYVGSFETTVPLSAASPPVSRPLEGLVVMLLEDHLIVALQMEDLLRELGASRVVTASTIAAAADFLERAGIDFAVLDIHVGSASSLAFALVCLERSIPFIFASGHGDDVDLGDDLRRVPIVHKPLTIDTVGRAVTIVLASPPGNIAFPSAPGLGPPTLH